MTWGCANQCKPAQALRTFWLMIHSFSPLLSSHVNCFGTIPCCDLSPPHLMISSLLLPPFVPSLHACLLPPRGSWDWGLRGKRADWVCPFWLLCLLSPQPLSTLSDRSSFPLFISLLLSSLYPLDTSLLFASHSLHPPESNLNKQCCSLFPLMCRLGPDAAGYVGGILMAVGDKN